MDKNDRITIPAWPLVKLIGRWNETGVIWKWVYSVVKEMKHHSWDIHAKGLSERKDQVSGEQDARQPTSKTRDVPVSPDQDIVLSKDQEPVHSQRMSHLQQTPEIPSVAVCLCHLQVLVLSYDGAWLAFSIIICDAFAQMRTTALISHAFRTIFKMTDFCSLVLVFWIFPSLQFLVSISLNAEHFNRCCLSMLHKMRV